MYSFFNIFVKNVTMKKIIFLLSLIFLFNSCDFETGGCTDPLAYNYESFADFDDGTCLFIGCTDPVAINYNTLYNNNIPLCIYSSDVVFFEDVAAATYFDMLGIQFLDIYIEGTYVGTLQANLGFTYVPDCFPEDPDAVHFAIEWENSQTTSFTWTVRDEFGQIQYQGTDAIIANDCLAMELTWKKIQEYQQSLK